MEKMEELKTENLRWLLSGNSLNTYQMRLANQEYKALVIFANDMQRKLKNHSDLSNVSDASCANCTKCITNYRTGMDHLKHYCSLEAEGTFLTEPENHKCGKWEDDR